MDLQSPNSADAVQALHWGVPASQASVLCVFVHGRGQTPEDMVEKVIGHLHTNNVHYVLPRAKGKSWYKARAIDQMTDETTWQLAQSVQQISDDVSDALRTGGVGKRLVLSGFSQGACLALEYAWQNPSQLAAVCAMTGSLVGVFDRGPDTEKDLGGLPVYLSGSDADSWIPADALAATQALLAKSKARLRSDIFPERLHTVCRDEIAVLDEMLKAVASAKQPFGR